MFKFLHKVVLDLFMLDLTVYKGKENLQQYVLSRLS